MKMAVDISAGKFVVEGEGPELLRIVEVARELLPWIRQIQIITSGVGGGKTTHANPSPLRDVPRGTGTARWTSSSTIRQFARSLSLNNASERIATLAYHANKIQGRTSFSPKEVDGWFTMCGFPKPAQMSVSLYDAKRKYGYIENIGRGMWRIAGKGERLVLEKMKDTNDRPGSE